LKVLVSAANNTIDPLLAGDASLHYYADASRSISVASAKLTSILLTFATITIPSAPALARQINGDHRCTNGEIMNISGFKGTLSRPSVMFKGARYEMWPYTYPSQNFAMFVDYDLSGTELVIGSAISLNVRRGGLDGNIIAKCIAILN
jgi:hypothetical protein